MPPERKRTKSGLPILRRHRHAWYVRFEDLSLFTKENDHNPVVAAQCPTSNGVAT